MKLLLLLSLALISSADKGEYECGLRASEKLNKKQEECGIPAKNGKLKPFIEVENIIECTETAAAQWAYENDVCYGRVKRKNKYDYNCYMNTVRKQLKVCRSRYEVGAKKERDIQAYIDCSRVYAFCGKN